MSEDEQDMLKTFLPTGPSEGYFLNKCICSNGRQTNGVSVDLLFSRLTADCHSAVFDLMEFAQSFNQNWSTITWLLSPV